MHEEHLPDAQLIMAADRTMLAIERTYAAWVRTGFAALASGVTASAILGRVVPFYVAETMASLLILFSGFCFVAGVWRELRQSRTSIAPSLSGVPAALLIAANSIMVLVSLAAMVGVWIVGK